MKKQSAYKVHTTKVSTAFDSCKRFKSVSETLKSHSLQNKKKINVSISDAAILGK